MLRRLYDWTLEKAAHPHAEGWLALIAFLESSIFPVPPDGLLVPMALAERRKALRFALVCTLASFAGALAGYALGHFLWESVGEVIIHFYGYEAAFARFSSGFREYGVWLVLLFGVSFFPFKVITIASGLVAMDPLAFALASLVARSARFFPEAWLLWRFGAPIRAFIERRLVWIASLFTILLVGGILLVGYGTG